MTNPNAGGARAPLPPIDFEALAAALLARADTLVAMWLPGGVRRGHEYVCGSLSGGSGDSCSINLTNGRWADFAADEKGNDLVGLYAAIHGLTMGKAAVQVAREEGLEDVAKVLPAPGRDNGGAAAAPRPPRPVPPPAPKRETEGWATVAPVPEMAPATTFKHYARKPEDIDHVAEYRVDDALYGYVVRFRTSDGGKDTLPLTWCVSARDGAARWHWKTWDEPRPLYYPNGRSPGSRTVVLVEGEKKAGVLQALLDTAAPDVYCVASWAGGCKAWQKASWEWLAGCTVLLWPDCDSKREALTKAEREAVAAQVLPQLEAIGGTITDNDRALAIKTAQDLVAANKPLLLAHEQPGMKAQLGIGRLLAGTHGCNVQLLDIPPPGLVADGWDCADAINTERWTADEMLVFFAHAQPLPSENAAEPEAGKPATEAGSGGKKTDGPVDTGDGGGGGNDFPWWLRPYWDADKSRWLVSRKMVIAALTHDEALSGVLAYNELSNSVQAMVAWPWQHARAGDITDADDLLLGQYLSRTYGLPSISRAALAEAIQTVAHTKRWHPVRDRLASLQWDGVSRIDKWLIHVLGETPSTLKPALREYLALVGRCWVLGMVYRVMRPGCKFDYCPVLEGVGGLRKSTLVETLACQSEWYSDTPFEVGKGKEAQEQVQGLWMYEIAEMTHFSKAEVGAIKAFITSKVDRYRVAYGATVGSYARQCVLVGTTNENTYLRDRTGNRRFWPIHVRHIINIEWLTKWRDQIFAEAYALYLQDAAYTPTPDQERRLFEPMQENRLVETAVQSELLHLLTRDPGPTGIAAMVNNLADFVTIAQLTLALGVDAAKSTPALEAQVRGWLDHEGWQRVKRQINGVRAWGYERPKDWPAQDSDEDMEAAPEPDLPPPTPAGATPIEQDDDAPF